LKRSRQGRMYRRNRPTNVILKDEDIVCVDDEDNNKNNDSWQILFGGDIFGLLNDDKDSPSIVLLYNISTELGRQVFTTLLPNVFL